MNIIEQSHEIIGLPYNLLQMIEVAGRTCYKSEDKIGCILPSEPCPDRPAEFESLCEEYSAPNDYSPQDTICNPECPHHSSQKFAKMLLDRGHHAMIEFGDIIVRFITNRGVTHELVRHRLFSFAQESTRYVRYDGGMEFIRPVWCSDTILGEYHKDDIFKHLSKDTADNQFMFTCEDAEEKYLSLLDLGWRPEQAREVLPNSLKTEIVVKGNIRQFRHMLGLRCAKTAHPQIRSLMRLLLKDLRGKIPVLFDDLYIKYIKEE